MDLVQALLDQNQEQQEQLQELFEDNSNQIQAVGNNKNYRDENGDTQGERSYQEAGHHGQNAGHLGEDADGADGNRNRIFVVPVRDLTLRPFAPEKAK